MTSLAECDQIPLPGPGQQNYFIIEASKAANTRQARSEKREAIFHQGVSKVTTAVFRSRESENSHQFSGLYPNIRMAEERFNVGILRISEMSSGPGVRTIEKPIKDTYHTSVLFTVKP